MNRLTELRCAAVFLLATLSAWAAYGAGKSGAGQPAGAESKKAATPAPAAALQKVPPEKLREDFRILPLLFAALPRKPVGDAPGRPSHGKDVTHANLPPGPGRPVRAHGPVHRRV